MSWEDIVAQLAFGSSAPKRSSCLGLYLSPETIYIAQTRLDQAGKLAVDHLVRIPVPIPEENAKGAGSATATLNTSFLTENARLADLIRQTLSHIRWNSKRVMVTLSHHLGLLRYFTMPAIERRFWKTAVPLEAKKHIPIPFDLLGYDYQCVPLPADADNRPHMGTLIAVTQKQNLSNIAAMLESVGLAVAGMEVAPCSVLKLWQILDQGQGGGPCCQVHFDGGSVRILVADKGLPVFFREVFLGGEAGIADQRKVDLGGCIAFAQKQLGAGSLSRIQLSGSNPELAAWKEAFARESGLPVVTQDTAALAGVKSGDWGGCAAIGASLRFQVPGALTLDLGAVGRITEEEHAVAWDIFVAGGTLTLLLLALGLFKLGVYQFRARELNACKRDAAIEAVFRDKTPPLIDEMFRKMREQAEMTRDICGQRVKLADIMKDVVESLPEKAWLTKISISRPLGRGAGNNKAVMTLSGHAVAEDLGREQELAFQFRDSLAKAPLLSKIFPDLPAPQVNREPESSEPGVLLNPDAFVRKQEERTNFTVTASARTR